MGMGRPAIRAFRCLAADSRRTASVGIGSIMRAPSYAIDHHRSNPSPEPILHRAFERIRFCEMLVASKTDPRRAALVRVQLVANSDSKARSALRIRKSGQIDQIAHIKASPEFIGGTAQSEQLTL